MEGTIPAFRESNQTHRAIAATSEQCHLAAGAGDTARLQTLEKLVDEEVAKLWSLSARELTAVQRAIADLHRMRPGRWKDHAEDDG
jgi:hypothetical protein